MYVATIGHAEDVSFHVASRFRCGLVAGMTYAVQRQQSPVMEDSMGGKGCSLSEHIIGYTADMCIGMLSHRSHSTGRLLQACLLP